MPVDAMPVEGAKTPFVVKNTFLELAEDENMWGVDRSRRRASTGPILSSSSKSAIDDCPCRDNSRSNLDTEAGSSVGSDSSCVSWSLETMCPTDEEDLDFFEKRAIRNTVVSADAPAMYGIETQIPNASEGAQRYEPYFHSFPYRTEYPDFASSPSSSSKVPVASDDVNEIVDRGTLREYQLAQSSNRGSLSESPRRKPWQTQPALSHIQRDSASESPRRNRQWAKATQVTFAQNDGSPHVAKRAQWSGNAFPQSSPASNDFTTIMLRNVPNDYTRDMLMELLESKRFGGCYDFVYVPFDFKKHAGLGYAFLNLVTHEEALRAMRELGGFHHWKVKSQKVLQVTWSTPLQGLAANVERYRNSPVMHPDVPEQFKPLLFEDGMQVAFPAPTKVLQMPNIALH